MEEKREIPINSLLINSLLIVKISSPEDLSTELQEKYKLLFPSFFLRANADLGGARQHSQRWWKHQALVLVSRPSSSVTQPFRLTAASSCQMPRDF